MVLGARESRDHQLSRAPKIMEIHRLVFAGDDFEKICIQINDEIPVILIGCPEKKVHGKEVLKKTKTISLTVGYEIFTFAFNFQAFHLRPCERHHSKR